MTRRAWLLGCGGAVAGLLAVTGRASLASPPAASGGGGLRVAQIGPGRRGAQGQGGLTLVNGSLVPVLATEQPRLRLRLLNASDQRIYALGFAGDVPFHQVASDGGLLPAPVRLTRLQLGPAERAEVVVDLADRPGDAPVALQRFGGGFGTCGTASGTVAASGPRDKDWPSRGRRRSRSILAAAGRERFVGGPWAAR